MKKLNKKELAKVRKAARKIAAGTETYTCTAINRDDDTLAYQERMALRSHYKEFYAPPIADGWSDRWANLPYGIGHLTPSQLPVKPQLQRSLMLLLFAELKGML